MDQLVHKVYKTVEGLEGLSEAEKQFFAVGSFEGDTYNGGFDQYFTNTSGDYYDYAVLGLQVMEANHSLKLLQLAKQIYFDFDDVPKDHVERSKILKQKSLDFYSEIIDLLDKKFYEDPDKLRHKAIEFVKRNGLV